MDTRMPNVRSEVFRPRAGFAASMAACGMLWLGVLVYLLQFQAVPMKTFLSALFFVVFFGVSLVYYGRTAIFVDAVGVTYRGMVRTEHLTFEDIRKVAILPGPVTVYAVRAGGRGIHFTSFFRHHRRLVDLLVQRARLTPLRG